MSRTYTRQQGAYQQAEVLADLILRHAELVGRAHTAIVEGEKRAEIRKGRVREHRELRERRKAGKLGRVIPFRVE